MKFSNSGSIWLFWLHLLLAARLEMRPGWPRSAHRLLVGTVPGWPRLWPRWPHQEWPGVAKPLKQLHSVAFRCIPYRLRGAGMRGSRLRGNDGGICVSDTCNQCRGRRRDGAMSSCRRLGLACPNRMARFPSRPAVSPIARFTSDQGRYPRSPTGIRLLNSEQLRLVEEIDQTCIGTDNRLL